MLVVVTALSSISGAPLASITSLKQTLAGDKNISPGTVRHMHFASDSGWMKICTGIFNLQHQM